MKCYTKYEADGARSRSGFRLDEKNLRFVTSPVWLVRPSVPTPIVLLVRLPSRNAARERDDWTR